ncbi:unnamed protein product, partial [Meganyctiphanes norvegica]
NELKNVHNLEWPNGKIGIELIRIILFYRLPGSVQYELINMTNSNYPSLDLIFDKLEEAITKLVIIQNKGSAGIGNQNYKQSTKSSNPSDLSKIQGSSDPKKAFLGNTGNSTPGNARKGKKFTKKGNNSNQTKKCIFCNA